MKSVSKSKVTVNQAHILNFNYNLIHSKRHNNQGRKNHIKTITTEYREIGFVVSDGEN